MFMLYMDQLSAIILFLVTLDRRRLSFSHSRMENCRSVYIFLLENLWDLNFMYMNYVSLYDSDFIPKIKVLL